MAFFDLAYETFRPQQLLFRQVRHDIIVRPIAKVLRQLIRIVGCDDIRIKAIFGIKQVFGFQKMLKYLRILAPNVSTAKPSIPMLPGNRAAKGMYQIKHRICNGLQLFYIVRVLQVQKGPGMQQPLGNVSVNHKRDLALVKNQIDSPEIVHKPVSRNCGIFNQRQDFFLAFQFVENWDSSLANSPEFFLFQGGDGDMGILRVSV